MGILSVIYTQKLELWSDKRELLADDVRMLREIGVLNNKIQELIELNKIKYGYKK